MQNFHSPMQPSPTSFWGTPPVPSAANPGASAPRRVLVVNAKGGCGKSTLATNLASWYAQHGLAPALIDFDPQGSSIRWLAARQEAHAPVYGISGFRSPAAGVTRSFQLRIPQGVQRVVVDTPAGIGGQTLLEQVRSADVCLIPVLPSPMDIDAAAHFVKDLASIARVKAGAVRVGIVANRVRKNTRVFHELVHFLHGLNVPFVARLRDTQNYIRAAADGVGIGDLRPSLAGRDQRQWAGLVRWVEDSGRLRGP